jgi:DNA-binding YbaB/EbfC family protein
MTTPADHALSQRMGDIRRQLAEAEQMVGSDNVTGTAGGGAVRIGVRGEFSFTSVEIDPRVVDPAETELLEDLLLAALRDAVTRLAERRRTALGGILAALLGDENGPEPPAGPPPAIE